MLGLVAGLGSTALGGISGIGSLIPSAFGGLGKAAGWIGNNLGALGNIGGSIGSIAGNFFGNRYSSKKQKQYQAELMQLQYELQKKGLLEFPTAQRKGLLDAGYNPMLALTQGSAQFHGGSGSVGLVANDFSSASQAGKAFERLLFDQAKDESAMRKNVLQQGKKDLEIKSAERDKIEAEADLIRRQGMKTTKDTFVNPAFDALNFGLDAFSAYGAWKSREAAQILRDDYTVYGYDSKGRMTEKRRSYGYSPANPHSYYGKPPSKYGWKRLVEEVAKYGAYLAPLVLSTTGRAGLVGAAAALGAVPHIHKPTRERGGRFYNTRWESNKYFSPLR